MQCKVHGPKKKKIPVTAFRSEMPTDQYPLHKSTNDTELITPTNIPNIVNVTINNLLLLYNNIYCISIF